VERTLAKESCLAKIFLRSIHAHEAGRNARSDGVVAQARSTENLVCPPVVFVRTEAIMAEHERSAHVQKNRRAELKKSIDISHTITVTACGLSDVSLTPSANIIK
jgi:hypothetical protein